MSNQQRAAEFLSEFFDEFIENYVTVENRELKVLHAKKSYFLGDRVPFSFQNYSTIELGEPTQGSDFDFIFINPPFLRISKNKKTYEYLPQIIEPLTKLGDKGMAFMLLPSFGVSLSSGILSKELAKQQLFINSVINLPEDFLIPDTSLRPMLVGVSRTNSPVSLFAEFENWETNAFGQFEVVIQNILNLVFEDWKSLLRDVRGDPTFVAEFDEIDWDDLWNGVYSSLSEFKGFDFWKLNEELERTVTDYKNFECVKLGEICSNIRVLNKTLDDEPDNLNSIFIPIIGEKPVVESKLEFTIKNHNYAELIINPKLVHPNYLVSFLNSKFGRMLLATAKNAGGHIIPKLTIQKLHEIEIRLPNIEVQKRLAKTIQKITEIQNKISEIQVSIELNPLSSKDVEKLDAILNSMTEFTIQDKVRNIISVGENKKAEFKQTLSLDVATKQKNKSLEHSALKTIAAFLNSVGGTLLIGVADNGEVTGLDVEIEKFHKTDDQFLKHLKNLIKRSIGEEFYTLIDVNLIKINGKSVALIETGESDSEVFLNKEEFFVRTNPATDKLEGPKLLEYCKKRFFRNK